MGKEFYDFVLRLCGGNDSDSEAEDVLELFVGGFRENGVLFDTQSIVPHLIGGRGRNTAEVLGSWQSAMNKLLEEVVHPLASECRLVAHNVACARFESGDRNLCPARSGLLPGNARKPVLDNLKFRLVFERTHTGRNNHLH